MYFYGSFTTQLGETVTVHIVTENSRAIQVEIGDENGGVFFTTNPVEIENSVNDTFDHLLRSQATIRLLVRDFIPDFFCASCMDAVVNIYKGDKCIFAGFIEPQTYSQGYNDVYDELEISCIDVLSALQYSKYRNVGGLGVLYEVVKANAGQLTFGEIIGNILNGVCASIDITGTGGVQFYYDGSKSMTEFSADRYMIFQSLSISELLFLGKEENDTWQQDEVLEAILKYLNLHIAQEGLNFYIFSWESIKDGEPILWMELTTFSKIVYERPVVEISLSNVDAADTTISIGEVYNQILLTCKTENLDDIVLSPLDSDSLVSPYSNRQKYMTEYSVENYFSLTSAKAFWQMVVTDGEVTTSKGMVTDWYLRVMNNPSWVFPDPVTKENLIDKYCQNNSNQQILPNSMASTPCAALIALGKVDYDLSRKDNSPVSKVDMSNYLVVSVNGNCQDNFDDTYPNESSLLNNAPCAVYAGNVSGGVYSPSDVDTTNYIVISGKILLNPIVNFSTTIRRMLEYQTVEDFYKSLAWVVYEGGNGETRPVTIKGSEHGQYYTQKYYRASTPSSEIIIDPYIQKGLVPQIKTGEEKFQFTYSAIGDNTDKISKIAVLACMLIIGDKCLIETEGSGYISDFKWIRYKSREECQSDDEYYQQCFTIGFDPKIDDYLIGKEFDIQNNITLETGLNIEGMAIPIKKSDYLNGAVKFMILGPVNTEWDVISRRHRTWFRRVKWTTSAIPLLAHVSNIFIKDFNIKIYSDNNQLNESDDSDLVYLSDTHETFVNRKEDIEFKINSALTKAECQKLGVSDTIRMSTPLDISSGAGVLAIYDRTGSQFAKPEQLYVDSYYREYHKPRILMTQKLKDTPDIVSLFSLYRHPAMLNKNFYVQGISRNLIEGYAELTLKEVWND